MTTNTSCLDDLNNEQVFCLISPLILRPVSVFLRHLCWVYLVFDHGAEVIIPEKDTELSLLYSGRQLTQAVVRQLSGCAAQKLLCYDTWEEEREGEGKNEKGNVNKK